ncbi:unnamed protein product [Lactuca virosa]|uniref:ATP-dependent DNA helicase n=1 Tax=Lactuca virosa TaxID=75947 RepID=A0AAU9NQD1_9ASTR|nr:unnamed protein product [Lactuca virosa]
MLDENKSLVKAFRMAKDRFHDSSTRSVKIRLIGNRTKERRQYNLQTVSEVAALIPGDGSPIQSRDVLIEDRGDGTVRRISELHPSFMALQYPLLFPYGEDGFHLNIPLSSNSTSHKRKNVTLREYYCFRLHFRLTEELPSQENDPVAFEAVRSHMMHGPCGQLNTLSPCMHNGSFSKGYPKEYCDETFIRRDGWPCYKRSNDGLKVKVGNEDIMLDNRYVVPHNVDLLVKYGCHINVEYCNQGNLIKYLFSYINKGHDRATVVLEDAISLGCSRKTTISEEDCQRVYYREDDDIAEVLDRRVSAVSKFTEWMRENQLYEEARLLTYSDFPTKFTWHEKGDVKEWRPRKNGLVIGRLYFVNPNEGERYYLRMLLNVVRGPCSFKDIRTVDGEHPTYMSACKALRLLGDDGVWVESIREASQWQSGKQLRELFVTILLFCDVADQEKFFWDSFPFLSEDVAYNQRRLLDNEDLMLSHDELVNYTLLYIDDILYGNCRSLVDFPSLPQLNHSLLSIGSNRLIVAERTYNVKEEIRIFNELYSGLNVQQKEVYTIIINAVNEKTGEDDGTWITIPDDLLIPVADNPIDAVTSIVFPDILSRLNDMSYIKEL